MPGPRNATPARYLRALQRRVDSLARLEREGKANSYHNAERRALNFAIGEICRVHNISRPIGQKEDQ